MVQKLVGVTTRGAAQDLGFHETLGGLVQHLHQGRPHRDPALTQCQGASYRSTVR